MMLQQLIQPVAPAPICCTIIAEGGRGKTSLGSLFPAPVWFPVENGLQSVAHTNPQAFPLIQNSQQIIDGLGMMLQHAPGTLPFKTVVIDTISKLNEMIESEVVAMDPKRPAGINQAMGGYGNGFSAVALRHGEIKRMCDNVRYHHGMNIVFLCHADIQRIELPDSDPYDMYAPRLHKKSWVHYVDDVDLVGFIKLKQFTFGEGDRKKASSDGTLLLVSYPVANNVSKNRYGISEDLIYEKGVNPLTPYVPCLQQTN